MKDVAALYNQCPEREWDRLPRDPYHTLEFMASQRSTVACTWRKRLARPRASRLYDRRRGER